MRMARRYLIENNAYSSSPCVGHASCCRPGPIEYAHTNAPTDPMRVATAIAVPAANLTGNCTDKRAKVDESGLLRICREAWRHSNWRLGGNRGLMVSIAVK